MTSRIDARFEALREQGRAGLVTYVMAGDPDYETSLAIAEALPKAGADVIELGMPFTDPMADGPAVQAAGLRALKAGQTLKKTIDLVRAFRKGDDATPLILMGYYNPIYVYGVEKFLKDAKAAGVDGVIVVDLPPEESGELRRETDAAGVDMIHMVAPTSTPDRVRLIARRSRGFIYLVSLTGVTGERAVVPDGLEAQVRALRLVTTKPICVGFGISRPEHAAAVGRLADGVAVGSAIVRAVEEHADSPSLITDVGDVIESLKAPLRDLGATPTPS